MLYSHHRLHNPELGFWDSFKPFYAINPPDTPETTANTTSKRRKVADDAGARASVDEDTTTADATDGNSNDA